MSLFDALVQAFVKNADNFANGLDDVPIAGHIVVDAWESWHNETDERQRKSELESYARKQKMAEVTAEARASVRREASQLTADLRAALLRYLAQVPACIRRSLRRPADHTGLTVPASLPMRQANDLLPFLPLMLPPFQPDDKLVFTTNPPGKVWLLLLAVIGGPVVLVGVVLLVVILINSNTSATKTLEERDNKAVAKQAKSSETIVQGQVFYKGMHLNGGAIDVDSKPARGAAINPDGTFRIKGVPPGKYRVKFVPLGNPKEIEPPEAVSDKTIQGFATSGIEIEVVRAKTNEVRIEFK